MEEHELPVEPGLSLEEAGVLLGISPHTLRVYVRQGRIGHFRIGRRIVLKALDIRRFLEDHRVEALAAR